VHFLNSGETVIDSSSHFITANSGYYYGLILISNFYSIIAKDANFSLPNNFAKKIHFNRTRLASNGSLFF
jgi:hypothetical protein